MESCDVSVVSVSVLFGFFNYVILVVFCFMCHSVDDDFHLGEACEEFKIKTTDDDFLNRRKT